MWCSLQEKERQILSLWAILGDGSQVGHTICWLGASWYHFRIPLHVAQPSLSLSSESIFSSFHYRKWLALFSGLIRRGNMSCLLLGCLEVRVRKHLSISRICSVYFHQIGRAQSKGRMSLVFFFFNIIIMMLQSVTKIMASFSP